MKKPILLMLFAVALVAAFFYTLQLQGSGEPGDTSVRRGVEPAPVSAESGGTGLTDVASTAAGPGRSVAPAAREAAPGASGNQGATSVGSVDEDDDVELTRLTGTITDATGVSVPGAAITVRRQGFAGLFGPEGGPRQFEAASADDGSFDVQSFQGDVELAVGADGFAPFDRTVDAQGEVTDVGEVRLATGVTLAGRVVDSTGAGVPGATLKRKAKGAGGITIVRGDEQVAAVTGPGGEFQILRQAPGPFEFEVVHPLHPPARLDGSAERPGDVVSDLVVTLEPGASLRGIVTGMPASASSLTVHCHSTYGAGVLTFDSSVGPMSRKAEVLPDGSFELVGLRPGERVQLVLYEGKKSWDDKTRRSAEIDAKVPAAGSGDPVAIPFSLGTTLRCTVVDDVGTVLEPTKIEAGFGFALSLDEFTQDPATGEILLPGFWPEKDGSELEMMISRKGHETWSAVDVTVFPGALHDLGRISLRARPTVEVTVVDDQSGEPVPGARVTMALVVPEPEAGSRSISMSFSSADGDSDEGADGLEFFSGSETMTGTTDDEGVCPLDATAGALVNLRVSGGKYAPWVQERLQLPESMTTHAITARMSPGGALRVTVTESSGAPAKGFGVEFNQDLEGAPEGPYRSETSDDSGELTLEGLPIGDHEVRLTEKRREGAIFLPDFDGLPGEEVEDSKTWTPVTIVAGETTDVSLAAPATGALGGTVREQQSKLSGATLKLKEKGSSALDGLMLFGADPRLTAKTDAGGRYRFEGVEVGEYELSIHHPTRVMPHTVTISIEEGEGEKDFDLRVTEVVGRVLDGAGEPVQGARVTAALSQGPEGGSRRVMSITMVGDDDGDALTISSGGSAADAVLSGPEGGYRLRGVTPDVEIVVTAAAEGHDETKSEPFSVTEGSTRDGVDLTFQASGSLKIDVEGGGARKFAIVQKEGLGTPKVQPLKDGSARLPALAPGTYSVSIQDISGATFEPESLQVEVKAGEEATATFVPAGR